MYYAFCLLECKPINNRICKQAHLFTKFQIVSSYLDVSVTPWFSDFMELCNNKTVHLLVSNICASIYTRTYTRNTLAHISTHTQICNANLRYTFVLFWVRAYNFGMMSKLVPWDDKFIGFWNRKFVHDIWRQYYV